VDREAAAGVEDKEGQPAATQSYKPRARTTTAAHVSFYPSRRIPQWRGRYRAMRRNAAEQQEGSKRGLAASTLPLASHANRETAGVYFGEQHDPDTAGSGVGSRRRSVLLREKDSENARRHRLVRGIERTGLKLPIVIIDFPEDLLAVVLEAAEVVLAMRIVLWREGREVTNAPHNVDLILHRQGSDPGGDIDTTVAGSDCSQRIIEPADFRSGIHRIRVKANKGDKRDQRG
jgi:hypothetical protein